MPLPFFLKQLCLRCEKSWVIYEVGLKNDISDLENTLHQNLKHLRNVRGGQLSSYPWAWRCVLFRRQNYLHLSAEKAASEVLRSPRRTWGVFLLGSSVGQDGHPSGQFTNFNTRKRDSKYKAKESLYLSAGQQATSETRPRF